MTMSKGHRVAVCGVFDIDNYGDQLFPIVAAHRLKRHGMETVAVSPVDRPDVRSEAMRPRDLTWLMTTDEAVDAVLIGGGNILYNLRADYAAIWRLEGSKFGEGQHTGLWLGAAMAAAMRDIPFGFNAPGAPYPFSTASVENVLGPALAAADVVSVRDEASARLVRGAHGSISVVPDTAADIADVWPLDSLRPALKTVNARLGRDERPYAAIHLRAKPGDEAGIREVALRLDAFFAEQELDVVLVVIGDDLGDGATARGLAGAMRSKTFVLDSSAALREVAAVIANARFFMGGTLHGYITAAAYGVPGVLVPSSPHNKFAGFLNWMERPQDLARSWSEACDKMAKRIPGGGRPQAPAGMRAALDAHWDAVADMVRWPARRKQERAALLKSLTARAGSRQGMGWLLAPLNPASSSAAPV